MYCDTVLLFSVRSFVVPCHVVLCRPFSSPLTINAFVSIWILLLVVVLFVLLVLFRIE